MKTFEEFLLAGRKATDEDLIILEKQLAKNYLESYREVIKKINEFKQNGYTEQELRKYGRLQKLQKEIEREYTRLTGKVIDQSVLASADVYIEAYKRYEWALDSFLLIDIGFGFPPVDAVRSSVYSEQSGLSIIKTFKKNANVRLSDIQGTLTRGLIQGKSAQQIAAEMKDSFNRGYNDSIRVVRTENGRNYTEGFLSAHDKALELGIDVNKVWIAGKDRRTRPTHGKLDGQKADNEGYFKTKNGKALGPGLFGIAEEDINCRCVLIDQIGDEGPTVERIRGEGIVPYRPWTEWAESKGWTPGKGWPKVGTV